MIDVTLNVETISIGKQEGQDDHLVVALQAGLPLPFARPGSNLPVSVPAMTLRFKLDKDSALRIGEQLKEEGETLKSISPLEVATDLHAVEQVASAVEKIKG